MVEKKGKLEDAALEGSHGGGVNFQQTWRSNTSEAGF